jgi:hypothetical protein
MQMNVYCFSTYSQIKLVLLEVRAVRSSKDKSSVLVCANIDGYEKVSLLVSGKS